MFNFTCIFIIVFSAEAAVLPPRPGVPHLSEESAAFLQALRASGDGESYQQRVNRHTLADLKLLYAPENASKVEVFYSGFNSDTPDPNPKKFRPGDDLGYGLHVIRRLRIQDRNIFVNEHWPTDRETGGIILPDEIRVQFQAFEGPERIPGSELTYLYDSFRIAWGPSGEVEFYRQTSKHNPQRRVPVTAPESCMECHNPGTSQDFAHAFLEPGEFRNFETIVADSNFRLPYREQKGLKKYLAYLREEKKAPGKFVERAAQLLETPASTLQLPDILAALRRHENSANWLPGDAPWARESYSSIGLAHFQQGSYLVEGKWYLDALEEVFEGKYRWWFPPIVVRGNIP